MPIKDKKVYPEPRGSARGKPRQKVNLNLSDETKSFQERIDEVRGLVEENLRYTKAMRQAGASGELKVQKEFQKLLQENLKISKELHEMTKKIKRWVTMQRIWGVLKILIILVPIILGVIYLPPLVRKGVEPLQELYQQALDFIQQGKQSQELLQQLSNQPDVNEIIPQ